MKREDGALKTGVLTKRQKDVLELITDGLGINDICKVLNISRGTVNTHITAIHSALRTSKLHQLVALYYNKLLAGCKLNCPVCL